MKPDTVSESFVAEKAFQHPDHILTLPGNDLVKSVVYFPIFINWRLDRPGIAAFVLPHRLFPIGGFSQPTAPFRRPLFFPLFFPPSNKTFPYPHLFPPHHTTP